MRRIFSDNRSHALIFDDEPYKVYYAKATGTPQLQYIPFNSDRYQEGLVEAERIYKGEGTLTLICYEPFAHCPNAYKDYDNWVVGNPIWYKYNNKLEWNLSAQLLGSANIDKWKSNTKSFALYNPGDLDADFTVMVPINTGMTELKITNNLTGESTTLSLKGGMSSKGLDTHIQFNSKTNLIEGIKYSASTGYVKSGNIYNDYINGGTWFKIPQTLSITDWELILTGYNGSTPSGDLDYELCVDTFTLSSGKVTDSFIVSGNMITEIMIKDAITNQIVEADLEIINRKLTINLIKPHVNNISIIVTSNRNNSNVPFIQYDYLYL